MVTGRRRLFKLVSLVEYFAHEPGHTKFMLHPEDRFDMEPGDTIVDTESALDIESLISRFAFGGIEEKDE